MTECLAGEYYESFDVLDEHEGGAWQVGVDWDRVLQPWFKVLAATATPEEYAGRITALLEHHHRWGRDKMLTIARKLATESPYGAPDAFPLPRGTLFRGEQPFLHDAPLDGVTGAIHPAARSGACAGSEPERAPGRTGRLTRSSGAAGLRWPCVLAAGHAASASGSRTLEDPMYPPRFRDLLACLLIVATTIAVASWYYGRLPRLDITDGVQDWMRPSRSLDAHYNAMAKMAERKGQQQRNSDARDARDKFLKVAMQIRRETEKPEDKQNPARLQKLEARRLKIIEDAMEKGVSFNHLKKRVNDNLRRRGMNQEQLIWDDSPDSPEMRQRLLNNTRRGGSGR